MNCDAANARRLVEASIRQRNVVARLDELGLLYTMDERLVGAALLRRENPQSSLSELGAMQDPPVSKAVMQSRMRRLQVAFERATSGSG